MSKLVWDATGERLYETGTKKGVLFRQASDGTYENGIAWNGLTAFTESPDGGEANDIYADDTKYLSIRSKENFKGTIEAYTYPDEFAECDGSAFVVPGVKLGQQARKSFGFSYVSTVGNDVDLDDHGYLIHLIYGASAAPSEKAYQTVNDSPEAITFSWEIDTVPVEVGKINGVEYRPVAHITIDSTKFTTPEQKTKLEAFETTLYGSDNAESTLPLPAAVISALT